jgi:hypothetical protein
MTEAPVDTIPDETGTQDQIEIEDQRVFSPQFIAKATDSVQTLIRTNPTQPTIELLHLFCVQMSKLMTMNKAASSIDTNFILYLEIHSALATLESPDRAGDPCLYNEAAFSFFDLYTLRPYDTRVAKLLTQACLALREVAVSLHSDDEDAKAIMTGSITLALLVNSVPKYTRRFRQSRNKPFIRWLRQSLDTILLHHTLATFPHQSDTKSVVSQIMSRKSSITLPI